MAGAGSLTRGGVTVKRCGPAVGGDGGRESPVRAELTAMASAPSESPRPARYLECEDCGFLGDETQIDEVPADRHVAERGERVCPVCHGRAFPVRVRHAA